MPLLRHFVEQIIGRMKNSINFSSQNENYLHSKACDKIKTLADTLVIFNNSSDAMMTSFIRRILNHPPSLIRHFESIINKYLQSCLKPV